jgi:hypothetical protein
MRPQAENHIDRTTPLPAPVIQASTPCLEPPAWALAQRSLFQLLDEGWRRFAALYTRTDGSLRYAGRLTSRDGADDFLETFFNWPQLYLLGGSADLLEASARHWHGVVAQLTGLGMFRDEFEIGYDWFHQGESMLFFYFLTLADPDRWRERAVRFAELYVDPVSILAAAQAQARRRLALMESHAGDDPGEEDIHLWQNLNPSTSTTRCASAPRRPRWAALAGGQAAGRDAGHADPAAAGRGAAAVPAHAVGAARQRRRREG